MSVDTRACFQNKTSVRNRQTFFEVVPLPLNLCQAGGKDSNVVLRIRHEPADLASDDDARDLQKPVEPGDLQRRMRDEAPSIYLFWLKRLDVIDRHFCGLPRRPESPEPALDAIHRCAPGETP